MRRNYFTQKQQEQLRENPYVEKVSETNLTYTREFREAFIMEYQSGKLPSQILREMDIDPRLLGKRRIDSIVHRIKQYKLRPEGCKDMRSSNCGRPSTKELSDAEKIKHLEQKIAYLKQENEFLKKNIQMDRQAEWEHTRHQPANTSSSKK